VKALLDVIGSAEFKEALDRIGGYDTGKTGEIRTVS
jgi:hypothetical protein